MLEDVVFKGLGKGIQVKSLLFFLALLLAGCCNGIDRGPSNKVKLFHRWEKPGFSYNGDRYSLSQVCLDCRELNVIAWNMTLRRACYNFPEYFDSRPGMDEKCKEAGMDINK